MKSVFVEFARWMNGIYNLENIYLQVYGDEKVPKNMIWIS